LLLHITSEPPNTGRGLSFPQASNRKSQLMFSTGPTPLELAVDDLSTAILLSDVLRFSSQRHSVAEQGNG
ncbi:hypothetical protein ACP3V9_25670, partial [Salmonella enterica]|uniref:hypothetical protein n=1 Tax=Salmonella enterica TaxID=28901 RepID=UPI003CFB93C6